MERVAAGPPGSKSHVQFLEQLPPQTTESGSPSDDSHRQDLAKEYNRKKLILGLMGTFVFFVLALAFVASGWSRGLDDEIRRYVSNDYLVLLVFVAVVGAAESILASPLSYYTGYHLEHVYHLSNQTFAGWIWEHVKGMMVSLPIGVPILLAFYYCLRSFGDFWWFPVGTIMFFVTVVFARIGPVLIFPLFYKFVPLEEGGIKERILKLCSKVGVAVEGLYTFNLSKNTKKANAAFTGIGKSKRIILGDTLVQNFTDEEVEAVFAHELGHYTMKHLRIMMVVGTVSTFLGLYLTARLYAASLPWFGFVSSAQIGALPLLTLWLGVYSLVTSPIANRISQRHEYAADRYAVHVTGRNEPFIHALKKLAIINLADTTPPAIVEMLFHSHPSIEKRIRALEAVAEQ